MAAASAGLMNELLSRGSVSAWPEGPSERGTEQSFTPQRARNSQRPQQNCPTSAGSRWRRPPQRPEPPVGDREFSPVRPPPPGSGGTHANRPTLYPCPNLSRITEEPALKVRRDAYSRMRKMRRGPWGWGEVTRVPVPLPTPSFPSRPPSGNPWQVSRST